MEMNDMNAQVLSGKVAVVTGAGRGIGAAIAQNLASLGANVVLCGRTEKSLQSTASQIGPLATAQQADVTKLDSVLALADTVEKSFGKLDILVNNAGVGAFAAPLHQLTPEDWEKVLNTNLRGVYYCI